MASISSPPSEPAPDRSTQLAEMRTTLGQERTFLAFERSLMAWLRTSLSMISFGFTLAKFFQYLEEQRGGQIVGRFGRTWALSRVRVSVTGSLPTTSGTFQ